MPAGVTIKIKGVEFSSLGAAARHFNVSPHTISKDRARYPGEPDKWVELVKANKLQMPKANERTGRVTFAAAPAPGPPPPEGAPCARSGSPAHLADSDAPRQEVSRQASCVLLEPSPNSRRSSQHHRQECL